jgi:hypothetical protein
MSDEPLVAIAIPTYRRLDMLREAIGARRRWGTPLPEHPSAEAD